MTALRIVDDLMNDTIDHDRYLNDAQYHQEVWLLRNIASAMVQEMEAAGVNRLAQHHILVGTFHRMGLSPAAAKARRRLLAEMEKSVQRILSAQSLQRAFE